MTMRLTTGLLLLAGLGAAGSVSAGYWFDSADRVWRTTAGECVRTGYWAPESIVAGCDGMTGTAAKSAEPAPTPAAPTTAAPAAAVTATVSFGFDRAELDGPATAEIDRMLGQVSGTISAVRLTGHADRIGTEAYNVDLSLRRASAVNNYLSRRVQIEPQKIEIAGKGEAEPLVSCEGIYGAAAIRCLAPNRRVDVMIDMF